MDPRQDGNLSLELNLWQNQKKKKKKREKNPDDLMFFLCHFFEQYRDLFAVGRLFTDSH